MNIHQNARLTPLGLERLVRQIERGQTPEAAARAAGVTLSPMLAAAAMAMSSVFVLANAVRLPRFARPAL